VKRPVRAVCFDLLSALLDSWAVWDRVAEELGAGQLGRPWRHRYLERTARAGGWRAYLELVSDAAADVGLPRAAAALLESRWDTLQPWPDVVPAMRGLALSKAVVTNCSEELGARAVRRVGMPFDLVVTAERAGAYKPASAPYRLACAELGCLPAEVAYVAGSPFDAVGALAEGFRVTWVNRLGATAEIGWADRFSLALPDSPGGLRIVRTLEAWRPD
jgi:2-haloacid dehalogenase